MTNFQTSLLREKFILQPPHVDMIEDKVVTANSNRLLLQIPNGSHGEYDSYIVRAQNMHMCVNLAARVYNVFENYKTIPDDYNWQALWEKTFNDFEKRFNEYMWVSIYKNGRMLFSDGDPHILLALIEKCAAQVPADSYESVLPVAEKAIKQTGQDITLHYDGHVALNIEQEKDKKVRCSIILRQADRATTFAFTARPKDKEETSPISPVLDAASAFLEGVQLSFLIGKTKAQVMKREIEKYSDENKKAREGKKRIVRLRSKINNVEAQFKVNYRPERPDFDKITEDAEQITLQEN